MRVSRKDAGKVRAKRSGQVEFGEHIDDGGMKTVDILLKVQVDKAQGQSEISGKLARQMEDTTTAPVHPVDLDSQAGKSLIIGRDVGAAPARPTLIVGGCSHKTKAAPPCSPRS